MSSPTHLINREGVRQYTMDMLRSLRPHLADKFTRISDDYFVRIEANLRASVVREIDQMPTAGKTIK